MGNKVRYVPTLEEIERCKAEMRAKRLRRLRETVAGPDTPPTFVPQVYRLLVLSPRTQQAGSYYRAEDF